MDMTKTVLPEPLRLKIIEFYQEGMSSLDIYDLVYEDTLKHVSSEKQLSKCLSSLKGKATFLSGEKKETKTSSILPPKQKIFDNTKHLNIISSLSESILGKDFEKLCHPIVIDILTNYEGFTDIIDSNNVDSFHNPPFDFFGFRDGKPFIIEFKGSLENFNSPGETQKRRMQELLSRVKDLNIALLQVKVRKGQYRILCNQEMDLLFDGREIPLDPVIDWLLERIYNLHL
jgi:hypothetical protein